MQSQPHTDTEEGSFLPLFLLYIETQHKTAGKVTLTYAPSAPFSLSLLQGLMPDSS